MKKINAIIFDLGGVLLNIDFNKVSKAFKSLGLENFDELYTQNTVSQLFQKLEIGAITEENFYK